AHADDRRRREPLGQLGAGRGPGSGSVRAVELGDVEHVDRDVRRLTDADALHRLAEAAGERERLERQLVAGLDEDEDHEATPSERMTSTTAGAASAPCP